MIAGSGKARGRREWRSCGIELRKALSVPIRDPGITICIDGDRVAGLEVIETAAPERTPGNSIPAGIQFGQAAAAGEVSNPCETLLVDCDTGRLRQSAS